MAENIQLLCKGKNLCMADLLFCLFGELQTDLLLWLNPNQSNSSSVANLINNLQL